MSIENDIVQLVRGWLKKFADPNMLLTDAQVIRANQLDENARPIPPYLFVNIIAMDIQDSPDELVRSLDGGGDLQEAATGVRRGTISVGGIGRLTTDWIPCAHQALVTDAAIRLLAPETGPGISLRAIGALIHTPGTLDTARQSTYSQDFEFAYRVTSAPSPVAGLVTAEIEYTQTSEDETLPDLTDTITVP